MCGIAGQVSFTRTAGEMRANVEGMLLRLQHRGPDSTGITETPHAVLGNVRLSFLDRQNGTQPMSSADGVWHLTYNGEVYNWRELRRELAPQWTFRTQCDTEVVLAALATWGEQALPRLNGMFAFFLWNSTRREGFSARDRLGVKPFVYSVSSDAFHFASEAKALCSASRSPRAHPTAISEYFAAPFFSGVERSMFAGIEHLLPGQSLRITRNGITRQTWWDWAPSTSKPVSEANLTGELRDALEQAVHRSLPSEHPTGSFLSGGLDSTLLTSLASRRLGGGMKTFSIRFEDQETFDYGRSLIVRSDDTPFALEAARELGAAHTEVHVPRTDTGATLRRASAINDTLPAWEQEISQHQLARAVHEAGLRCVLVGDAADETHYGYPFLLDREATEHPRRILERFGAAGYLKDSARVFADWGEHYRQLAEQAGHSWATPESRLQATSYLIIKRWLPRLLQNGDIHTMAFSVEARVPFSDTAVLGVAQRVPASLALGEQREKWVLREAVRGFLPERHRLRPKSALPKDQQTGRLFQVEAAQALRASADFLAHWLDVPAVATLCAAERALVESERALLFRIICLHHWRETFNVQSP